MSNISRHISRSTPVMEPDGDKVQPPSGNAPYKASRAVSAGKDNDQLIEQSNLIRTSGAPSLDSGNRWNGRVQYQMETRSDAQTSVGYPNVSGNLVIDFAIANVFRIRLTGDTNISFDVSNWPSDSYNKQGGMPTGLEYAIVMKIDNPNGFTLNISANHWAPESDAPDLSRSGYYEVCMTINQTPGFSTIVSGYPSIQPSQ